MDLRTIKKSEYLVMPWKNGQGSTAQIDIVPKEASFPDGDFLWRLSSATVEASGPFSQFSGCDRWLVVLSGQGLLLNGKTLGPFTPIQFNGEDLIHAELLGDTVVDLGLIYRRGKVQAQMAVVQLAAMASQELSVGAGCAYLYCVSGQLACGKQTLTGGDSCYIEGFNHTISCEQTNALFILLKIQNI